MTEVDHHPPLLPAIRLAEWADVAFTHEHRYTAPIVPPEYSSHPTASLLPDLATELLLSIAGQVSAIHAVCSLATTCRKLYDILFPFLMRKAVYFPLRSGTTTTLHWASERGYIRVVKALLESGAAVNNINSSGDTSLMRACRFGHENIVECLIVYGADVDFSSGGETAFTCAAHFNHPSVMDLMFRLGTMVDRRHWWTLLSAAGGGHIDVARLLLEHGVDVNFRLDAQTDGTPIYTREYINWTAVYMAAFYQHPDLIALLVDYGADVDAMDDSGETALQYLISKWPHLSLVEERCLHELCKGSRWRKMRWKVWRALLNCVFSILDPLMECIVACVNLITLLITSSFGRHDTFR